MPKKAPLSLLHLEKLGGVFMCFWSHVPANLELHTDKRPLWTILLGGLDSLYDSFEYLLYSERLRLNERKMPFRRVKDYV